MEPQNAAWISLQETAGTALQGFVNFLPSLVGALAVLSFGWLLARLVRATSREILRGLNRVLERTFQHGLLASVRLPMGASTIFGEVVFWVVIFITLTISARIAQLPVVSRWLNELVIYMPSLLLGVATIVVGYVVSVVVGEQVAEQARAATTTTTHSTLLGRLSQGIVFAIALIIGLDQIGVDVTLFVALAGVAIGAVLVGFSIAFGLGAQEYVSNLISARTVRQNLSTGLLVRIGEIQGEVLEITQTHVVIDTDQGRALVPAQVVEENGLVIISLQAPDAGQAT